jgi:hypothetical protein
MSQLRSDILHRNKRLAIEKSEKLYKRNHIAISIQPHETFDSENNEYSEIEDEDIQISEDEDIEIGGNEDLEIGGNENIQFISEDEEDTHTRPIKRASYPENESDTINSTEQWVRVIQNWMDIVRKENIDYSDGGEADSLDFIAVDRTIHPADDPLAKWNLHSIFNNSLESPIFVNALINLDSN